MNHRRDRQLRRQLKKTPLHESRGSLRSKAQVDNFAKKFASGLGELPYKIMDKYYRPEKYVSRDMLTELGDTPAPRRHKALLGLAILLLFLLFSRS